MTLSVLTSRNSAFHFSRHITTNCTFKSAKPFYPQPSRPATAPILHHEIGIPQPKSPRLRPFFTLFDQLPPTFARFCAILTSFRKKTAIRNTHHEIRFTTPSSAQSAKSAIHFCSLLFPFPRLSALGRLQNRPFPNGRWTMAKTCGKARFASRFRQEHPSRPTLPRNPRNPR
jgi:hypothetical protein